MNIMKFSQLLSDIYIYIYIYIYNTTDLLFNYYITILLLLLLLPKFMLIVNESYIMYIYI